MILQTIYYKSLSKSKLYFSITNLLILHHNYLLINGRHYYIIHYYIDINNTKRFAYIITAFVLYIVYHRGDSMIRSLKLFGVLELYTFVLCHMLDREPLVFPSPLASA